MRPARLAAFLRPDSRLAFAQNRPTTRLKICLPIYYADIDFDAPSNFGVPRSTLNAGLGGLSALYQIDGPIGGQRSLQLSARLSF